MRCDIIIPVWNQLALTKDCIDSIKRYTDDYRLILVDNASDGATKGYLESLRAGLGERALVINNEENLGFVKAVNQGIRASGGPAVCIMNNDALVTKDWLKIMTDVLYMAGDIGIVNPSSNNLGQKPAEGEPIELYAEKLRGEAGKFVELGAAIGFCMLIKREVIDKIGVFDEIYGMGNFEDTDFSRRTVKEGYRCVRACGAYVYHRESSSFRKVATFEEDFRRNREIYEFRWGRPKRIAYILEPCDDNTLRRIHMGSLKSARDGNWVWYFLKGGEGEFPLHSNIVSVKIPDKNFYLKAIFGIVKKKKKFDEIFVGNEKAASVLRSLEFLHKAKVSCY